MNTILSHLGFHSKPFLSNCYFHSQPHTPIWDPALSSSSKSVTQLHYSWWLRYVAHTFVFGRTHARRKREFTLTQIWFSPRPLPKVWEADVELKEGGHWGRGAVWEVDQWSGSFNRHCAACTFFSLYNSVCVCVCVCVCVVCVCIAVRVMLTSLFGVPLKYPATPKGSQFDRKEQGMITRAEMIEKTTLSHSGCFVHMSTCMCVKR